MVIVPPNPFICGAEIEGMLFDTKIKVLGVFLKKVRKTTYMLRCKKKAKNDFFEKPKKLLLVD